MQAVIPAAGMGKRLGDLTKNNTKCMVKVNGVTLIERMLAQLDKLRLSRIIIVVGYEGDKLIDFIESLKIDTPIKYIRNHIYDKTNNIYSLALTKEFLVKEDTVILESDLILEYGVLEELINDKRESLALVDKYESWMDGTILKIDAEDSIKDMIMGKNQDFKDLTDCYKTVNIYKFSQDFSATHYVPFLEAYLRMLGNNQYYEEVLRIITILDDPGIKAKKLSGQLWYEIDDIQDLDIASSLFESDEDKKLELFQKRYGGYWRYDKLIDFCYLVNPFFPPAKMVDEIKYNFEKLLCSYPSGMNVNSLLAAKNFGVSSRHIIIGNGAAELIKGLMNILDGNTGYIFPTFDEYPNRYDKEKSIIFIPQNENFTYSADDAICYFNDKNISALIIINPDNPTGNYIYKDNLVKLLEWTNKKEIKIIIDESFADFSDETDNTLIDEEIINKYKNLIIIKSISKSYGIPGLRLGVLAAYDEKIIESMKKEVSIWNINSIAEFYMQIEGKYQKDYENSLVKLRETRKTFIADLNAIEKLRILPSHANYIMAEILAGVKAKEITKKLLINYNILVKDLTLKMNFDGRQFIRFAIRTKEDNTKLISALKEILND